MSMFRLLHKMFQGPVGVPGRAAMVVAACMTLWLPAQASACGGFFCNLQNPIDQAAERILYITSGSKVTAHIQIRYDGPAAAFSWVLPLSAVPKLGIGSDSVFTVLEQLTKPQYYLQQQYDDPKCHFNQCMYAAMDSGSRPGGTGTKNAEGGVQVLLHEAVGPYDTVVIKGTTGKEVRDWLDKNGYGQPKGSDVLLDAYAQKNFVFLALKLQQDKLAGDLQPIVITVDEVSPCLPIRLTGIAAKPDMPIVAWILGDHRAIPKNYLHVQLNEKTIDWFTGGGNYMTVASKAVDQASGHAFLTEFAGKSSIFQNQFAQPQWDVKKLEGFTDPGEFLNAALSQNLPRTSQLQDLLRKFIPKPEAYKAKSDQEFYGCLQQQCGKAGGYPCDPVCAAIKADVAKQAFDAKGLAAAIQSELVLPLNEVQTSFDTHPYLTRLFTLVSPEEMTKDPIFAFNADLPDVSNQHTTKGFPVCPAGSDKATHAKLVFADASTLTLPLPKSFLDGCFGYSGGPGGFPGSGGTAAEQKGDIVTAGGQPARSIEVLDESGQPLVIDQSVADQVDAQLANAEVGKPSLPSEFKSTLPPVTWKPDAPSVGQAAGNAPASSGCTAGRTASAGWPLLLAAFALVFGWRMRRKEV